MARLIGAAEGLLSSRMPSSFRRFAGVLWWGYQSLLVVLALAVVWLLIQPDRPWVHQANLAIWGVFAVDYTARLGLAKDRRAFVRGNVLDLIAILPLDFFRLARLARLMRLVRLIRAMTVLWRVAVNVRAVLATNGLGWVLLVTASVMLSGALVVWRVEPAFETFGDALWWSLVTATTVGYGDLSPETGAGRAAAAVLMLVGIATLGMVTASLATFFIHGRQTRSSNPAQVEWVRGQLEAWETLDKDDRVRLAAMLDGLARLED